MSGMDICTETSFPEPDLAQLLPRAAFYEIAWMLRQSLPQPLTDDPVELERRDQAAMAAERRLEPGLMRQWTAQAVSLMRESKSALRELRQLQAARRRRDADAEAANRAVWEERSVVGMMCAGLGETKSQYVVSETGLGLGGEEFGGCCPPPPAPPHEGRGEEIQRVWEF